MDIKSLKPSKNSKYINGDFDRFNPKKYFGKKPIWYRSGYELIFMQKVELNPKVEKWSSENIQIPYIMKEKDSTGKLVNVRHTYNIDFTVFLTTGEKYIIEVKPLEFVPLNESQIKRDPVMQKNACKWRSAIQWAKFNGYEFKIVTEKHLKTRIF